MDVDLDKEVDVYKYGLYREVGELEGDLGEGVLTQSSKTGLITTQDKMVDLF